MANTYMDTRGLYHKYGNTASVSNEGGEFKTFGSQRQVEFKIDLSTLSTSTQTILSDVVTFPKGVFVEEVTIDAQTATASSGSGTFDIGLIANDRTTEVDFNGFIAAEVAATFGTTPGKKLSYNASTSKAGALIGTVTTAQGYVCANLNTAVYQTGIIYVRIMYRASN